MSALLSPTLGLFPFSTTQACFTFFAPFGFVKKKKTSGRICEAIFFQLNYPISSFIYLFILAVDGSQYDYGFKYEFLQIHLEKL